MGVLGNWLKRFKGNEWLGEYCDAEENNIIRRVLAECTGVGCHIEKNRDGRGWKWVVDGSSDSQPPPDYTPPWGSGNIPFEILYQDTTYIQVRDGLWETIGPEDHMVQYGLSGVTGGSFTGDPTGIKEDLAPSGGWSASTDYVVYALLEAPDNNTGNDYWDYSPLTIGIEESGDVPVLAAADASRSRYKILGRVSTNSDSEPTAISIIQLHKGGYIGLDNISTDQFRLMRNGNLEFVVVAGSWTVYQRKWDSSSETWYEDETTTYPTDSADVTWNTSSPNNKWDIYCSDAIDVSAITGSRSVWLKLDVSSTPVLTVEIETQTFVPSIANQVDIYWRKIGEFASNPGIGFLTVHNFKSGSVETVIPHELPASYDAITRPVDAADSTEWRSGDGAGLTLSIPSIVVTSTEVKRCTYDLSFDEDGRLTHVDEVESGDIDDDILSFLHLNDTPATYAGAGSDTVKVNATPDALEFVTV